MSARALAVMYAVRLLDHFAFGQEARLDIIPTVSDVTVRLKRLGHYTFVMTLIFSNNSVN